MDEVESRLLFRVDDALGTDGKDGLGFGQRGTVVDLANPGFAATLAKVEPSRAGVRHDVAADRLLRIGLEHGGAVHGCDHLIGDDNGHSELERDTQIHETN